MYIWALHKYVYINVTKKICNIKWHACSFLSLNEQCMKSAQNQIYFLLWYFNNSYNFENILTFHYDFRIITKEISLCVYLIKSC